VRMAGFAEGADTEQVNKKIPELSRFVVFAGLVSLLSGCATHQTTALRVFGTPGASFTAHTHIGTMEGTVSSTIRNDGSPSEVLEGLGKDFSCDISKKDPSATVTAEVIQQHKTVFRTEAPAGTHGVRISRANGKWQSEIYRNATNLN